MILVCHIERIPSYIENFYNRSIEIMNMILLCTLNHVVHLMEVHCYLDR